MFLNELVNGIIQVLLFAVIPFVVWLLKYRKEDKFFIGLDFEKSAEKR